MSLARQGKVKEAETMIAENQAIPDDLLGLEVLAVIVTSEGDYARGLRLWEQLLQRDPKHPEAKRMVPAIQLWLSRPSWVRYVPAATVVLIVVLVGAVLAALMWESKHAAPARSTAPVGASPVATPSMDTPVQPTTPSVSRPAEMGAPSSPPAVSFPPPKKAQRQQR